MNDILPVHVIPLLLVLLLVVILVVLLRTMDAALELLVVGSS